jgi:hypothetical protein
MHCHRRVEKTINQRKNKQMKSNILKYMACAAMALGLAATVQAAQITGDISLAGNFTVTGGNINTATKFATFSKTMVTSVDGDFAGITLYTPGSITMVPFTFNPLPSTGQAPLWTAVSGVTLGASFDLTTITSMAQPGDRTLTLHGTGTMHLTGFDDTPGTWVFSGNQSGQTLSFSSSNGNVPDGGMTVMLLGAALSGLALIRRKLA